MSSLLVAPVLEELNGIVAADGAVLRLVTATTEKVELELDLTSSSCPECVVPKELLLGILTDRLALAAPDVTSVDLHDPRVDPA
ncbi:hypothetical protein GIS00_18590 [Nakamurella sp. YIM 132087]|uniref:NifU family protein n=1 Tax=Nakamurella alba TaxID=2665158 RepID=A0A7K1FP77_9ACTN|nr:hypothetical protein [Nakamurella alba]MTD15947.1 hypothetical protein [Nakamurella alba]